MLVSSRQRWRYGLWTNVTRLMMLLVTGGAGFIGSNVVACLNEAGRTDIAVNDILGTGQKWRNLAGRRLAEFVPAAELLRWLEGRKLDAVVHMGAISSTTENNVDLLMENNFRLSLRLFEWCTASRTPFIYASSAATYGDGAAGFSDDWSSAGLARTPGLVFCSGWGASVMEGDCSGSRPIADGSTAAAEDRSRYSASPAASRLRFAPSTRRFG